MLGVDRSEQPVSSCVAVVSISGAVQKAGVSDALNEQVLEALRALAERKPAAVGFSLADVHRNIPSDYPIGKEAVRNRLRALDKAGRVVKADTGLWQLPDRLSDAAAKKPEKPTGSLPVSGP